MARDYDHLFKLLIIGDSGEGRGSRGGVGPAGRGPRGPRSGLAGGEVPARAGLAGGAARWPPAARECRGAPGRAGLRLGLRAAEPGGRAPAPLLAPPASCVTLVKSHDQWRGDTRVSSSGASSFLTL